MAQGSESGTASTADTSWFVQDRFGLFIHWGLYSMGARHEWLMHNEQIPVETYESRYFKRFDPDLYDPKLWAQAAGDAGMKYFVITTKHHDGFCLWDSEHTDYKVTNTPYGKCLLTPMIQAFRERGFRTGLYHSLLDWHHPDYVIDEFHGPYAKLPKEKRDELNRGRDQKRYAAYLHAQTRELLTKFGQIDVLWYDFSFKRENKLGKGCDDWQSEELVKLIRKLQPKVMLTDRLDLNDQPIDFKTPEQTQPRDWVTVNGQKVVWEACQTLSDSWGYHRGEQSYRTVEQLLQTLIDCVSKGGNLLLNVGPTARGEIDERALDRLSGIGRWMKRHARSIYGCTAAPSDIPSPEHARLTYNPTTHRLYVHLFAWPYKFLHLDGLADRVEYAQLLNDGSELTLGIDSWHSFHLHMTENNLKTLTVRLPLTRPDVAVPVVELFLK